MANTIQIKRGMSVPNLEQLESYELGYVNNGNLYIRETIKDDGGKITSDKIIQLTGPEATGLINADNYLKLPRVDQANFEADKFLVLDEENKAYYRNAEQVLSDLGAFSTNGGSISGDVNFNKDIFLNGKIVLKEGIHYGYSDPNVANIPGVKGQLYFVLSD